MDQTVRPVEQSATERKLMRAFMQMHRAEWHQRVIAGCSPSEVRMLLGLRHAQSLETESIRVTQTQISNLRKMLHVTSPAITQMLKSLEARGFVERQSDTNDRRMVKFRLTAQGYQVASQVLSTISESMRGLMAFLGAEQSEQLAELLTKAFYYFNERTAQEQESQWNGVELV